jgi:hypothetical protein
VSAPINLEGSITRHKTRSLRLDRAVERDVGELVPRVGALGELNNAGRKHMITTKRGHFRFRAKEGVDSVFIAAEPAGDELTVLSAVDAQLAFDLRSGTTYKEAEKIARYLNSKIAAVTVTYELLRQIGGDEGS